METDLEVWLISKLTMKDFKNQGPELTCGKPNGVLKSHQWMKVMDNWSSILLIIPKWVVSNLRAYILMK